MLLSNELCNVQISIDDSYTVESSDNKIYDIELNPLQMKHDDYYKVFAIEIDLFDKEISIALVGDFYSYEADCALLEENVLTVLSNNRIVQIDVVAAKIVLLKELDCFGCNYGIYKVKDGYIICGEIEITMLDNEFIKKWSFSGRDIFVSITGKKPFVLGDNSIKLYDFEDNYYEIDYKGNLISEV